MSPWFLLGFRHCYRRLSNDQSSLQMKLHLSWLSIPNWLLIFSSQLDTGVGVMVTMLKRSFFDGKGKDCAFYSNAICFWQVRVIGLFGSVWGIGPVTAQKLYEKGHRSLEDLKTDESLTQVQHTGLKFHFDIIKKIPRHEVNLYLVNIFELKYSFLEWGVSILFKTIIFTQSYYNIHYSI